MSFKLLADTFSVSRDAHHVVQLKTLKNPHSKDEIWVAFKIEGDPKYARSTMQSLLDTLDEVFFDTTEQDVYTRFEIALKEVNVTFKNIKAKRGAKAIGEVSAIVAVFSGNQLHLTQSRDAEAYLVRKGKLSLVSEGLSSRSQDLFVNIASGELLPEDKIIFATSRLLRLATHSQLAQMCSEGVVEALDALRELALSDSELSVGITCINTKLSKRAAAARKGGKKPAAALVWLQNLWDKGMKVVDEKTKGKKMPMEKTNILIGILGLVLILILCAIFLFNTRHDSQLREEYRTRIEEIRQDINTANTQGYANDKETANALLERAEGDAKEILETEYFTPEVQALVEKINKTRDSINNANRLSDQVPLVDLSTKRENVEALGLVTIGEKENPVAYEYNAIYEVKSDQVLDPKTIDENEIVVNATSIESQDTIVFLTDSGRVIEYESEGFRFVSTEDEIWKKGIDLASYGNFIYLLSPENNQIYKYTRLRSGYSGASEYNLDADLEGTISIAIDGSVYVLREGGDVIKLFKGERQDFIIEGLGFDLSTVNEIFTLPEHDHLYLFDKTNQRILKILKESGDQNAIYKEQIIFEDLPEIQDFYIDQAEDKLYLLSKKEIYEINI